MKLENVDRAVEARKELVALERAIEQLDKVDAADSGSMIMSAFKDLSGDYIDIQYKHGKRHPMYNEIFKTVRLEFIKARDELLVEIEGL